MLQLQIKQCPRDDVEQLNAVLEETAALSITLTDEQDMPILEPELGTTPLWPKVIIHALYAEEYEAEIAKHLVSTHYPDLNYSIEVLPEQVWERVCMADFKPQQFGERLWICPSWLTPPDPNAVNLILDPGLAFGTGTHPTTSLCLTWLEQANLTQKTMIDYGCGSGILALAALKLGVKHVCGVDIDEQALIATKNNALTNHLQENQFSVSFPDQLKTPVDLLIANILLTPLIHLQVEFSTLLKKDGTLVVSGIMEDQVAELIETYKSCFNHKTTFIQDGWALVEFTH